MSWKNEKLILPKIAASAIAQYVVVTNDLTTDEQVITAGSSNVEAIGITNATVPTWALAAGVVVEGVTKVLVVASTGAGARVGVASSNGGVGPVIGSGMATALGSALGAAGARYAIGTLQEARAAGEFGSVHLDPRQVVG